MAHKYTIKRLDKDELEYELKVRGVETGTVDEMRSRLAMALRLEKAGSSFSHPSLVYSFEEDFEAVDAKCRELEATLSTFVGKPGSTEALKLESKIQHVIGRIDRMEPGDDEELKKVKETMMDTILSLGDVLHTKLHPVPAVPVTTNPARANPVPTNPVPPALDVITGLSQSVLADISRVPSSSPTYRSRLPNRNVPSSSNLQMVPPHKWGIDKFSGAMRSLSVSAFFELVEEFRVARHVPKSVLLESGIDLFADKAYQFYKDVRYRVSGWDELVEEFRREYLPANHGEALFEELRKRTQHSSETIGVYLAVMSSYFTRLRCPVSEETKLAIIIKNLHPYYQDRLRDPLPASLDELRSICRRMEERRDAIRSYVEPTSRKTSVLERDLAFVEIESERNVEIASTASSTSFRTGNGQSLSCFRCNQPGHKAIGCLLPKKIYCFKCKKDGVTVRNCPKCNQGNASQRS